MSIESTISTATEHDWKASGAPYVEPDKSQLGDKHLDPAESVAREREDLLRMESKKKIYGQKELEDPERSSGPRMPWQELIRKLQKCNPEIRVREGMAGSVALYFLKKPWEYSPADLQDKANHNFPPNGEFFLDHKYLIGFRKEALAEYSRVTVDSSEVAHREVRGWRSVLITLIKSRVISYQAAIEEFGDPSNDRRSNRWFEQLSKQIPL